MPRPSKWNSPTTAIRVPAHLADELLAIARDREGLEASGNFVQNLQVDSEGLTAEQSALISRLVDEAIASCSAQGADPRKLLLYLKLQEVVSFLSQFRTRERHEFVARLMDEIFSPVESRDAA